MKKFFLLALALCSMTFVAQAQNDTIGPLLGDIEFDQGTPYNDKCPRLNSSQRSVTGCVATAMAEVMTYWRYPACGTGTATYSGGSQGATTYEFDKHPFDWDNILHTYTHTYLGQAQYNATQAAAVAELMLACGASVTMDYSAAASGSQTKFAASALKNHFGYDVNDMVYTESDYPNWEDWGWTIGEEIDLGRPVIFAGTSTSSGHCFVIDGYTLPAGSMDWNEAWFHVNWGWNGAGNGWFKLNNLRQGTDNWSNKHVTMIYGIHPPTTAVEEVEAAAPQVEKRLVNGEVLIYRDGVAYTILGQIR